MTTPQLITGIPIPYRIIIEGEVVGMPEPHIHALIQQGVSFNARLASCNRSFSVQIGKYTLEQKPE